MLHQNKKTELDSEPWYRQFWPWFLIFLPACAVVASLYTLSLAMRTTDSLVVDSNRGMDVVSAQQIESSEQATALGLVATVELHGTRVRVTLQATTESARNASEDLVLQFSHPAFAERDQSILLLPGSASAGNVYQGTLKEVPTGRWYLILESSNGWRLTGTLEDAAHYARLSSLEQTPGGHDD